MQEAVMEIRESKIHPVTLETLRLRKDGLWSGNTIKKKRLIPESA